MTGPLAPASGNRLWFMFWRTGSKVATANAFEVMKGA